MNALQKINTALRRHPTWGLAGAVGLAVLVGAGLRFVIPQTAPTSAQTDPAETTTPLATSDGTLAFESPMVSVSWRLQSATPSTLLASTQGSSRADTIVAGRVDPFAPITQAPPLKPAASAATATTPPNQVQAGSGAAPVGTPLPIAPIPTAGRLPALPSSPTPVAVPSTPVPLANLPSPSQLVGNQPVANSPLQLIELTGVAQVGDRVALIVREAGTGNSRYTFAGDYLANGQVLVKRIDVSSQEPLVILEYNGREYPRMVGTALASLPQ